MSISKMSKPFPSIKIRLQNDVSDDQDDFFVNVGVVGGAVKKFLPSESYKEFKFVTNELTQKVHFMLYQNDYNRFIGYLSAELAYDDIKEEMTIVSTNTSCMSEDISFKLFNNLALNVDAVISKVAP